MIDFSKDVDQAVDCMHRGGVILYPTDTVWGIGCDATCAQAVSRIYDIKRRADNKAMITLVDSIAMLERVVGEIPEAAEQLLEVAVDPLTIIYDHASGLTPALVGVDSSAAIRITTERYSRELCRRLRRPVVSTSANISGEPTPACFNQISPEIIAAMDYVALYRRDDTSPHRSSSVIKVGDDNTIKIIRP